jgi:hypothetical protein
MHSLLLPVPELVCKLVWQRLGLPSLLYQCCLRRLPPSRGTLSLATSCRQAFSQQEWLPFLLPAAAARYRIMLQIVTCLGFHDRCFRDCVHVRADAVPHSSTYTTWTLDPPQTAQLVWLNACYSIHFCNVPCILSHFHLCVTNVPRLHDERCRQHLDQTP